VATDATDAVMYGAIYADDCHASPAAFDSDLYSLRGIEVEIAYRFTENLAARTVPYFRGELERILVPFPVFEIVHSRFASYRDTPVLDRLADRMSNGGLVFGEPFGPLDAATVPVALEIDGKTIFSGPAQHSRVDPFLPALDFVRAVQHHRSFEAGQFITTGTLTGLTYLAREQSARATFDGKAAIALQLR
jgi:2-keto-4-pentenoate hydratase